MGRPFLILGAVLRLIVKRHVVDQQSDASKPNAPISFDNSRSRKAAALFAAVRSRAIALRYSRSVSAFLAVCYAALASRSARFLISALILSIRVIASDF
jgi:hypothetical protein